MTSLLLAIIYIGFISLGLPDSLLGSAWPSMYAELNVPISFAGLVSTIISLGTIVSSLFSDFLTKKLGVGKVMVISVALTAGALFGFSVSGSFLMLCLCAIPYGLGAGGVDAALNNYVAIHYSSRHMSWLHCMWGIGTVVGPYVMSCALVGDQGFGWGYRYISIFQMVLTAILIFSLPLWKKNVEEKEETAKPLSLREVFRVRGAKEIMFAFFCYCALESTAMLWASSYMHLHNGISEEEAAVCASIFFIGMTVGRFVNGFLMAKFTDTQMIRTGQILILLGIALLLLPFGQTSTIVGVVVVGLGCAPIYPCIIHSTPERFGADKSQAIIGVQMASAYLGTCLMPPLFGLIANHIDIAWFPAFLLALLAVMFIVHEMLVRKTK